ncbi:MAG TPA: cupin domain-containing protein [Steroidobacteraceae bacterium]|nr:cupin domain-containing protein [Steroidobacteraceae bacterium]
MSVEGDRAYAAPVAESGITRASLERDIPDRFQSLRRALGVSSFGLNLIVLQPRQRLRIHAHEQQEEVYIVLEGELTLLVEGHEHVLEADQLVRVGPSVRRQLVNAGAERLVLLALGGSGVHEGRDARAWAAWEDDVGAGRPPQDVPLPDDLPGA